MSGAGPDVHTALLPERSLVPEADLSACIRMSASDPEQTSTRRWSACCRAEQPRLECNLWTSARIFPTTIQIFV